MTIYIISDNEIDIQYAGDNNIKHVRTVNNDYDEIELTTEDIFVSYIHDSTIQARLENYSIPHDALCIVTNDKDLDKVLENDENNYEQDYYLFSGNSIKNLTSETKSDIMKSLKLLAYVMYQMLDAGYLQEEDNQKIADWIVPFEEPTLKLLKNYLNFETSNPQKSVEDEFIINPQFRKMILLSIMKILANYIINNGMISIDEVSKIGSWTEESTWYKLNKKLKLL